MQAITETGGTFSQQTRDIINANFAAAGLGPTQGNIYWVIPQGSAAGLDSGANNGLSPQQAFKTLRYALSVATAGQNDVILLCSESNTASATTDYQSSNLAWSKNMVHLIGINAGGFLGMRSRVANLGTAASFSTLFTVSGNGCLISGIEFFQGPGSDTLGTAQTAVLVSGQRNRIQNCQISGGGDVAGTMDVSGTNSLTISGSENSIVNCYLGLDTVLRATQLTEVILSGSPARTYFQDCVFNTYTSSTSMKILTIPTGADRWVILKNCIFSAIQNITSSALPSGAIGITTMNGQVMVMGGGYFGITQIVTADNAYVKVLALNGLATGHLIGIAQNVDAA